MAFQRSFLREESECQFVIALLYFKYVAMKNILVPTDFSDNAFNALSFAIAIANRSGSHITLLYAYQVYRPTGALVSVERYIREDADSDMDQLLDKARAQLMNGATIEGVAIKGKTIESLAKKADHGGFDLIVMGTQGATGLKGVFMGSTTNGVIRSAKTPVLAIPSGCKFMAFRHIALAMDSRELGKDISLQPLIDLVKAYETKLSIYHKTEGEDDQGVDPALAYWLDGVEYAHHFDFSDDNINESIGSFLEDYDVDLLCMIHHKRGFLEGLFHQSVTRKEAFTTDLPLLVLQDL